MKYTTIVFVGAILVASSACSDSPKVVEKVSSESTPAASVTRAATPDQPSSEMHEIVARETLDTERYTYVLAEEKGGQYWIAVPRSDVVVGETYYYSGGLLKRNFKSQEYDRTFEEIYLVSGLMQKSANASASAVDRALGTAPAEVGATGHVHSSENSVSLEEIFNNKDKYAGKVVDVTGECVKVNKQIMGRNWVHIQDGSGGDKPLDLTITTSADIPLGTVVTLRGTINLDRDFGAGYSYDVIMEDAHTH